MLAISRGSKNFFIMRCWAISIVVLGGLCLVAVTVRAEEGGGRLKRRDGLRGLGVSRGAIGSSVGMHRRNFGEREVVLAKRGKEAVRPDGGDANQPANQHTNVHGGSPSLHENAGEEIANPYGETASLNEGTASPQGGATGVQLPVPEHIPRYSDDEITTDTAIPYLHDTFSHYHGEHNPDTQLMIGLAFQARKEHAIKELEARIESLKSAANRLQTVGRSSVEAKRAEADKKYSDLHPQSVHLTLLMEKLENSAKVLGESHETRSVIEETKKERDDLNFEIAKQVLIERNCSKAELKIDHQLKLIETELAHYEGTLEEVKHLNLH